MVEPEVRAVRRLEALARRWKVERPGVAGGMAEALDEFRPIRERGPWASLMRVDWNAGRDAFARWLHEELDAHPPPARVKGLWFNVPGVEFNTPETWVVGSASFSTRTDNFDWASRMIWPGPDAFERSRRRGGVALDVVLEPLREVQRVLRVRPGHPLNRARLERQGFLLHILPIAYTTALLVDVLPLIWARRLLGKSGRRGIACGFQSGDGVTLGWLSDSGWSR